MSALKAVSLEHSTEGAIHQAVAVSGMRADLSTSEFTNFVNGVVRRGCEAIVAASGDEVLVGRVGSHLAMVRFDLRNITREERIFEVEARRLVQGGVYVLENEEEKEVPNE